MTGSTSFVGQRDVSATTPNSDGFINTPSQLAPVTLPTICEDSLKPTPVSSIRLHLCQSCGGHKSQIPTTPSCSFDESLRSVVSATSIGTGSITETAFEVSAATAASVDLVRARLPTHQEVIEPSEGLYISKLTNDELYRLMDEHEFTSRVQKILKDLHTAAVHQMITWYAICLSLWIMFWNAGRVMVHEERLRE